MPGCTYDMTFELGVADFPGDGYVCSPALAGVYEMLELQAMGIKEAEAKGRASLHARRRASELKRTAGLMRGVPVSEIASTARGIVNVWTGVGDPVVTARLFRPLEMVDFFISHCWRAPRPSGRSPATGAP